MQVEIAYRPAFSLAVVTLQPNERIRSEAGSMVSMSDGIALETSAGGGIMAHSHGPAAGVTAFREAWAAAMAGIPVETHARSHPALAASLETFK